MKYFKYLIFPILLLFLTSADGKEDLDELLVELDQIGETNNPKELDRKSVVSNRIAVYFQSIEAFDQAKLYLLKAIDFTEKRIEIENDWNLQNLNDMGSLYNNLALIEADAGDIASAKAAFEKFRMYLSKQKSKLSTKDYQFELEELYVSGFVWAFHANEYTLAEDYIKKALDLANRNKDTAELADLYRKYGELKSKTKEYELSLRYSSKAIELYQRAFPDLSVPPKALKTKAGVLYRMKNYEGVIEFLSSQPTYQSTKHLEEVLQNYDLDDQIFLINTTFIYSFAYIRSFETSKNRKQLEIAQKWQQFTYDIAEKLVISKGIDKLGTVIGSPEQKITSTLRNYELLQKSGSLSRKQISQLLRILDVHNSTKLHLDRLNNELNLNVWQKQKQLKLELEELTKLNPNWRDQTISDQKLDSITDLCYSISMEIQKLDTYTKRNELLNEYRIGQDGFISKLDQYVGSNKKTILSYFWSRNLNALYIIGINEKESFFRKVDTPKNFNELVEQAYSFNSHLNINSADIERQSTINQKLYHFFIDPVHSKIKGENELLIYPFGVASYVSFDALVQPNQRYLVQDFVTSYTSSLFSMLRSQKKTSSQKPKITSFYPTDYGTDTLSYLYHAKNEIESFERYGEPESFQSEEATKQRFLLESNDSKILHISSHSILNFDDPYRSYLLFDASSDKNNQMFAYEIFAETLDADLITLSSCNSSSGSLETGIGMVSLANAFYFSGIPATVGSMWSAQDKSSSEIMIDFYAKLFRGKKKSESLTFAKRKYLAKSDKVTQQPFFWANYALYGSDAPIVTFKKQENAVWFVGIGILVLIFLSAGYYRCSRSSLARL